MVPTDDSPEPSSEAQSHRSCHEQLRTAQARSREERKQDARRERNGSWARLGSFGAAMLFFVLARHQLIYAASGTVLLLLLFMFTVLRHADWQAKRRSADQRLRILKESLHLAVQAGAPVRSSVRPTDPLHTTMRPPQILASGPTWPLTDQERDDLDLYAEPVGLFGLLNRCSTDQGARRLRDVLEAPLLSLEHITQRQDMVRWLASAHEERIHIMASALPLRGASDSLDQLVTLIRDIASNPHPKASLMMRLWSLLSGPAMGYALLKVLLGEFAWVQALVLLMLINGLIQGLYRSMFRRMRDSVLPLLSLVHTLRCFLTHAEKAAQDLPDRTELRRLHEILNEVVTVTGIPTLCQSLEMASLGGIVRTPLNIALFYDLHVGEAVVQRLLSHRDQLLAGVAALAELEALNSLACFAAEREGTCYPLPVPDKLFAIRQGCHPLISPEEVHRNGIRLTARKRVWVVTGPNAAGKSTFLRMVGVNCLLAQVGSAVAAESMHWTPVRLLTDVRVRDDLTKQESYFMSEVRRLRRIIMDTQEDPPILGLIDEPFRGTNSQERSAAGVALLEHLIVSPHFFLVATHEELLAQCASRSPGTENYHFCEQLTDSGITFDYALRRGPASTKTAIRILEQEGYPTSFLERARALMEEATE